nr:nicotinamide-nucleotide amidohydrolase family protein [uncultured Mucilaginibacter sp.]
MAESKIAELSRLMAQKGLTISFAESATAGWLCSEFASEHSGKVLKGGIVCYDADLKVSLLGVPRELFDKFTPESMEVTRDLAERLDSKIPSDIQVGVTGLTAPGGSETAEKPVGTMFVFAVVKGKPCSFRKVFSGSREDIIHQTIQATAELLIDAVKAL